MFGNLQNIIQDVTSGNTDPQQLEQSASDHVSQMSGGELAQHLQTAAQNAQNNGQPDIAQDLMSMVSQRSADPERLKQDAVSYIKSNPQVVTQFAPEFAQGILNKFL